MELKRTFQNIHFAPDVIQAAIDRLFVRNARSRDDNAFRHRFPPSVHVDREDWRHDSLAEFFADYRRSAGWAQLSLESNDHKRALYVARHTSGTEVWIEAETRAVIHDIFGVFESNAAQSRLPEPSEPRQEPIVFIGHGRSEAWKELKDHLRDKHAIDVTAYEIGARAGHHVRDIIEDLLGKSSFAVLVMTGEDETGEGVLRARQNVVHEAGLFQGRLGFSRAVVLIEEGTESFSNIEGIERIPFARGNIRATFGDVLATIQREFGRDGNIEKGSDRRH
jgi:predicted nucleotide-binding protein